MINIEESGNLLNIAVMGEFTFDDFTQFENLALDKLRAGRKISLLFDLRAMINYSVDVVWEEIKFFGRDHNHDFGKIAVITDDQWLTWQTWLSRLFVDSDIRVFKDYKEGHFWVGS
jgi:hypothetical protein